MDISPFVINDQVRFQYGGIYVMYLIDQQSYPFTSPLAMADKLMEPILKWLEEQDYIKLKNFTYELTQKGNDIIDLFVHRYEKFLREYDVFCGVDLKDKSFAYAHYGTCRSEKEWTKFLGQDRWDDLRLAVAEVDGLDPVEMVFMSLIYEGRFGRNDQGLWDEDMILGSVWDDIQSICTHALRVKAGGLTRDVLEEIRAVGKSLRVTGSQGV